jgi:hypothetical protein
MLVILSSALFVIVQTYELFHGRTGLHHAEAGRYVNCAFISFYMAGKIVASEDRHHIYDPAVQLAWQNDLVSPARLARCVYLPQIPFFFLLMSPFAALPLKTAFTVWAGLSVLAGSFGLYLCGGIWDRHRIWRSLLITCAALGSVPGLNCFLDGQVSWWVLALLCFFFWAVSRGHEIVAGVITGLCAIKPHYLLFMLVPVLLAGNKKLVLTTAVALLFVTLAPGLVVGWDTLLAYPGYVLTGETTNQYDMLLSERMVSVRGPLSLLLAPRPAFAAAFALYAAAMAASGVLWHQALRGRVVPLSWAMSLTVILILIASPHTHIYDCILLSLPAVLTLPSWRLGKIVALSPLSLRLWCLTLLFYPVLTWLAFLFVPPLACTMLPDNVQALLSVNDRRCSLLAYYCLPALHLLLLAAGTAYLLKRPQSA